MRRNYISNSIFILFAIGFIFMVNETGYFSAIFLKDDFFYGAIVIPVIIILGIFGLVWSGITINNKKWEYRLTTILSMFTTICIALFLLLIPYIYIEMGTGLQIIIISIPLGLILFNVWIVEWTIHKKKMA